MLFIGLVAAAYICGSAMFAKFVGHLHHVDLRTFGSGNLGFANAARAIGVAPALPILFGDVAKSYLPTAVAASLLPPWQAMLVGIAAVAGHLFPFWLRFRGGKGVATSLGVALALTPLLGV